ncbi:MAG: radical SAM protein [Candidatus Omnitrophota bacterium]
MDFRKYNIGFQLLKTHLLHQNIPISASIVITNKCNLNCLYCFQKEIRNQRDFTLRELSNLVEELIGMGTRYFSINGGEALLRDDLDVIIEKIKKKNILCHLTTNGLLIKDNIPLIKKFDSIAISLQGNRESHDSLRGAGTYDKVVKAIELLTKEEIKFHITTVLTKNNVGHIKDILNLACLYKCQSQFHRYRGDKNFGLDDEELIKAIQEIIDYKKRGLPVDFPIKVYENFLNWGKRISYRKKQLYDKEIVASNHLVPCRMRRFHCHIEGDGLIYPCWELVGKFKALNFLEVGLKRAWENSTKTKCRACYNIGCNAHSLIFALNPSSIWDMFIPSRRIMRLRKIGPLLQT